MALAPVPAFDDSSDIGHYIGGQVVRGEGGRKQAVYNPATGQVARQLLLGGQAEVDAAVASAQKAFPAWANLPPLRRRA